MERVYNKLVRDNVPDIIKIADEKKIKRGSFNNKLFLEKVIDPE